MMFVNKILTTLYPIFEKHGFEIIDENDNRILFESAKIGINIANNPLEKSQIIEIGYKGGMYYPLNDNAIRKIWMVDLSLEQVSIEVFVENISVLFRLDFGIEILKGDIGRFIQVCEQQSQEYTADLLVRQCLDAATNAWGNNEYGDFVKLIDNLNKNTLPESVKMKYNIALKKLGS